MAGKEKDPNKTYSPNWGGNRGGKRPGKYPTQVIVVKCTDEELKTIKKGITSTRRRAEILLNIISRQAPAEEQEER